MNVRARSVRRTSAAALSNLRGLGCARRSSSGRPLAREELELGRRVVRAPSDLTQQVRWQSALSGCEHDHRARAQGGRIASLWKTGHGAGGREQVSVRVVRPVRQGQIAYAVSPGGCVRTREEGVSAFRGSLLERGWVGAAAVAARPLRAPAGGQAGRCGRGGSAPPGRHTALS